MEEMMGVTESQGNTTLEHCKTYPEKDASLYYLTTVPTISRWLLHMAKTPCFPGEEVRILMGS